jgi:hypothetical protein
MPDPNICSLHCKTHITITTKTKTTTTMTITITTKIITTIIKG